MGSKRCGNKVHMILPYEPYQHVVLRALNLPW